MLSGHTLSLGDVADLPTQGMRDERRDNTVKSNSEKDAGSGEGLNKKKLVRIKEEIIKLISQLINI